MQPSANASIEEARTKRIERRVIKAEKSFTGKEIKKYTKENPPFIAVLQGVDPGSERPPPYQNVRVNMHTTSTSVSSSSQNDG